MEPDQGEQSPTRPNLQLQASAIPPYSTSSLSPSFKVDEGYSDDTRSQSEKDSINENVMMLPEWVLAQSEASRAGKYLSDSNDLLAGDKNLPGLLSLLRPLMQTPPSQNSHTACFVRSRPLPLPGSLNASIHYSIWIPLSSFPRS